MALLQDQMALGLGCRALDVAAGTGKLTGDLVAARASVLAVEPVAGMRDQLRTSLPDLPVVSGTAESLPVRSRSADLVTVAQAFHWFDVPRALGEVHRVLRPGGCLAMIWNVRDQSVAWVKRVGDLIEEAGGGRPYDHHRSLDWAAAVADPGFATATAESGGFTPLEEAWFENPQEADVDLVVGRVASTSWVSALPDGEREAVLDRVRAVLAEDPSTRGRSRFVFPHDTVVAWCRKL